MNLRQALIWLNVAAVFAVVVIITIRVISLRRNPEPAEPQNKTPFLPDEDLEGRKLERVLGWSLLFTVVIAIALPVYFLVEPDRQVAAENDFDEQAVERGAALFANAQSEAFDPTVSLLCADCHGVDGQGGSTTFTIEPESLECDLDAEITEETAEECRPMQVTWQAPPLDVALLRYPEEQVTEIITFGRPGTPMPAWGVESGEGVLNEQGIEDLVAYIESIQITPAEAKERFSTDAIRERAEGAVADAEAALAEAEAALAAAPPDGVEDAQAAVDAADAELALVAAENERVQAAREGELVFESQCARCHTKGWSFFDPLNPDAAPAPGPAGGGAFGPNLTDGSELRQFPGPTGIEDQILFVAQGVAPHKAYGVRGISTGRMPFFNQILSEEQIAAVVEYERGL